jgi:Flp pilus assembly protein TadD
MRAIIILSALALAGTAGAAAAQNGAQGAVAAATAAREGEVGYARGALGYDALVAGDIRAAEMQLETSAVAANDPARLINLGYVHMTSGRLASAQRLFEAARDAPDNFTVELADGSVADTRTVATRALQRVQQAFASR